MPKVTSNGIEIYYEVHGSGPTLVLIAGLGYGCWYWSKLTDELKDDFQVVLFDNRGSGQSSQPEGPYTVPMLTADTAGLLDELDLKGSTVLGHSLGGFIAQELVVTRPDLVGKLILASTNHGGLKVIPVTPEALAVMMEREGDPVELVKRGIEIACAPGFMERAPDLVQELVDYRFTKPVPPAQYQAQVAAGAGTAAYTDEIVDQRLSAVKVPTLLLSGEFDRVVPPGNTELMAGKIADSQIVIIPNTGHMFPIEEPPAAAKAIRDFMLAD